MTPRLRRIVLTAHIVTSVGWLGAVAAYTVLDVTAVTSHSDETVRAAYLAMKLIVWNGIVPLALASVIVGIVNALGTSWGLTRHYWVLAKFALTLFAATVLLLETMDIDSIASAAASGHDAHGLPGTLLHSVGGMGVLLVVTILSVYKPRGLTPRGRRKREEAASAH